MERKKLSEPRVSLVLDHGEKKLSEPRVSLVLDHGEKIFYQSHVHVYTMKSGFNDTIDYHPMPSFEVIVPLISYS